jgi:flagellar motor switch protein FliN/FliY
MSDQPNADVKPAEFPDLADAAKNTPAAPNLDLVRDIHVTLTVELGRTEMVINDILALTPGKVIELDRLAGEPLDILVNGTLLAKGEVVVVDENFGIRLTAIIDPAERAAALKDAAG